jgi:hypothetical protein
LKESFPYLYYVRPAACRGIKPIPVSPSILQIADRAFGTTERTRIILVFGETELIRILSGPGKTGTPVGAGGRGRRPAERCEERLICRIAHIIKFTYFLPVINGKRNKKPPFF